MGITRDELGRPDRYTGSGNGRGRDRRGSATRELGKLIADVEEVAARLVNTADPEITRLRDQLERTVAAAKESLAEGADSLQGQAREAVGKADDYVRAKPWSTLAIVALAAMTIGFLTARR